MLGAFWRGNRINHGARCEPAACRLPPCGHVPRPLYPRPLPRLLAVPILGRPRRRCARAVHPPELDAPGRPRDRLRALGARCGRQAACGLAPVGFNLVKHDGIWGPPASVDTRSCHPMDDRPRDGSCDAAEWDQKWEAKAWRETDALMARSVLAPPRAPTPRRRSSGPRSPAESSLRRGSIRAATCSATSTRRRWIPSSSIGWLWRLSVWLPCSTLPCNSVGVRKV